MDKSTYPRCRDCKWWAKNAWKDASHAKQFLCTNPKLESFADMDGLSANGLDEIYTGPAFGCVHWEAKDGSDAT